MSNIIIPTNYRCELTPFSQRLLQYDLEQSKLFLTRSANFFLNSFTYGYDNDDIPFNDTTTILGPVINRRYSDRTECILDGFKSSISSNGTNITVKCSPGSCIIDTTMITIFEELEFNIDIKENYIQNAFLILTGAYKWNESILENKPIFKLFMISNDGVEYSPDSINWNALYDKMIINKFSFDFDSSSIINIRNYYPKPIHKYNREYLLIKNMIYEVCPIPNMVFETRNFISETVSRKKVFSIEDNSNWIQSSEIPFITESENDFSYINLDISDINKKECIVQCYINDMKIEPACIQHIDNNNLKIWMPNWFVIDSFKKMNIIIIG